MTKSKFIGVVTAVVVAIGSFFYWSAQQDESPRANSNPIPAATATVAPNRPVDAAPVSVVMPAVPPVPLASGPSRKLVAELQSAKDWRAFAIKARSRPEEGGYFYAMYVANICGMPIASMPQEGRAATAEAIAKNGTVSAVAMDMAAKLNNLCGSFAAGEASTLYEETKLVANDARDPLVAATRKLKEALAQKRPELTKEALKGMLDLEDPVVQYDSSRLLMVMSRSAESKGDLWFNGKTYAADDPIQQSTLRLAITLASCGDQSPCELDTLMMLACMGAQFCTDNRQEYLRHQYVVAGGMTNAQFADAMNLSEKVRGAVAGKQVGAFVR